jgi:hypothetical protein
MLVLGLNLICLTATLACQETLDPRLAAAGGSPARVVTVTDTVLPSRDTYISKTLPNQNFGSSDTLRTGGPNRNRALLAFDSAAIAQVVGTGQLDSAWLELTIVLTDGLGASGRTFDLHRLGSNWTELGATWNCPVDANTANDSPNCTGTSWDMTNGNAYASSYTARVTVVDQQTGVLRLNVTSDVAAFLGGTTNNYGWIFRKTNESLSGGTVTFSRNNPATGPRLVLSITRVTVPATPPDSVPTAVLNEIGNLMTIVRDSQGTYPPNFVQVLFQRSAAQADRQQAVDLIRGEVVGGVPLTEGGIYVVRLAPGATLDSLRAVISTLKALPQVVVAMPVYLGELDLPFVRPADGTGWTRTDWNLLANQAAGDNWALERINAPLAWGCQTGDTLVQIAVVDRGFRDVSQVRQDLWPNVAPSDQALFSATDTMNHGSRIASVLAAVGNNGKGMTGVLWQTRLRVFERNRFGTPGGPLIAAAFYALESAVQSGIPIVSMSMAYPWRNPDGTLRRANPSSPQDVQLIEDQFSVIKQAAQKWDDTGHKPLLVLAAGNDGIDARWALFPRLAEVLPSRVLVVGAANRSQTGDTLWRTPQDESNTGLLVSVVAPGEEVAGFDKDGNISLASGTSVATPMVAGIAGLLLSADPTLSADSLRSLILAGANRSGRTAAGIPLVNAYESLRAASEASGTPLCGNEVWVANGVLKARRGSTTETLATLNDTTGLVNVRHGGRRLDVYTNGIGLRVFQYDAGTRSWNEASNPYSLPDTLPGGTYLSSLFASQRDTDAEIEAVSQTHGHRGAQFCSSSDQRE